ncbi:major facilitator superfamily protein [Haloferax elongans ATCC BAA-1513]|uniref:Major facilitator superfamily protein n=1 Tax=Haloferax elongans ATCC BAA-1513 TaxID=1230453 RepID=M0HS25_HALEO|nr:MFS transporter [Haloferax elongans]ELZ87301.1 major facilitator superfamily protein [Haloferax elongans ATCC BAA-1513]
MSVPESAVVTEAPPPADEEGSGSKRALAVVIAIVFIDLLGFGVVIPILPFYVRSFAISDVFIGLLAASYSIMQFLAAPILGRISDQRGRRPVIMLSLVGSVLAWTVFGLAGQVELALGTTAAVATLFASRMLAGAMGGNIATAQAYIADITPAERRAGALGLIGASFSLGFIFGPAIGGLMASDPVVAGARDVLPAVVPATRFSLPSFTAAALSLVSLGFAFVFLREPDRKRSTAASSTTTLVSQFRGALADDALRGLVVAFFVVSVAFSGIQVMFIPFAADIYGYGETETALFLTYIGILGTLNQGVVVGQLARRYSEAVLAVVGAFGLMLALALLPFSPTLGGFLPAIAGPAWLTRELVALLLVGALLSFGNGMLNVSLSTLVSTSASDDQQGNAFGVTQGAGSLGRTVGPPAMAALYVLAYWSPFVAGAVLVIPVIYILAAVARRPRRVLS